MPLREKPFTVVLDERCSSLLQPARALAPTVVFTRSGGFLMSPRTAAEEMHGALRDSGASAPYVLIGASYAAFTQLLFAARWPQLVAGMILVDPSHRLQGEVALRRLSQPDVPGGDAIDRFRAMLRGFGPAWEEGCREVSAVTHLGNLPLVILEAGAPAMPGELSSSVRADLMRERHELLLGYAAMSSRGTVRVVEGASHALVAEKPDIVVDCLRELLLALRMPGGN